MEKSLYINRFEAVFGGHRHRIGPGTGSDQFFPATCSPAKIATCASIVFFNLPLLPPPPPLAPLFFSFLYFKGEAFPFSDVNSIFRASNSKIKKSGEGLPRVWKEKLIRIKNRGEKKRKKKQIEASLTSLL